MTPAAGKQRLAPMDRRFPRGFVWGAATSATQVEGAADVGGKSPSIWDRAGAQPGRIHAGQTPRVADDHYHRFRDDVRLMRDLGLRHYRFSINWCRIMPHGGRRVNQRGLDFYKRLCDALHDAGITPWATLYHWDLPVELEDQGGWPVRGTVEAFARYADAAVAGLRQHIQRWMTINELHTFIQCGYRLGVHAPFRREPDRVVWQAHHHVLLAHGCAVRAVREHGSKGSAVGFVHNPESPVPLDESPDHVAAARRYYESITGHYFWPLYRGRYAPAWLASVGADRPDIAPGDMDLISLPTDFLGLNQYGANIIRATPDGGWEHLPYPRDFPRGGFDWLGDTPDVLYWGPRFTHELYQPGDIYITENGLHSDDAPIAGGEVNDLYRCQWLQKYLGALHRACREGVPVRGYFHWTLMDNFEWAYGYSKRMGLIHVDFDSLRRTPKLSARLYASIASSNRLPTSTLGQRRSRKEPSR
jgi:beta-glucosidase